MMTTAQHAGIMFTIVGIIFGIYYRLQVRHENKLKEYNNSFTEELAKQNHLNSDNIKTVFKRFDQYKSQVKEDYVTLDRYIENRKETMRMFERFDKTFDEIKSSLQEMRKDMKEMFLKFTEK